MLTLNNAILLAFAGLGLVGAANAQTANCSGSIITVNGTPTIAVEGTTELLNDVQVTGCSGTVNLATITLTANVPLTNVSTFANFPALDIVALAYASNPGASPVTVNGVLCPASSDCSAGIPAAVVSESNNTVTVTFALSGLQLNSIQVSGLRVNATAVPNNTVVTISANGITGGGIGATIPATTVANVVASLQASTLTSSVNQSLCTVPGTALVPVTTLTIRENFNGAFKTAAEYTNSVTAATQGSRIQVTFNNLNANVNYYVPATLGTTGVPVLGAGVITSLATAAATPSTLALSAFAAASGGPALTGSTVFTSPTATLAGLVQLTVTKGSATVYYGVTSDDGAQAESAIITLMEQVPARSAVTEVSTSAPTATVSLVGVATGYPEFAAQTPVATKATAVDSANGVITACSTTMLFPYVTNQFGFDTGIAISNSSTGVTGVAGAEATAGTCKITVYGKGSHVSWETAVITSDDPTYANLLSGSAPGMQGYAVAVCNFAQAHGYAFLVFGLGTSSAVTSGYLAVVTSTSGALPTITAQ